MDEYVKLLSNLFAYKNTSNLIPRFKISPIVTDLHTSSLSFPPRTLRQLKWENISEKPTKHLNAKIIHIFIWLVLQQTKVCDQQYLYLSCMQWNSPSHRGKELKGNYALSIAFVFVCLQLPRVQISCVMETICSICYSLFLHHFLTMHLVVSLLLLHLKNL